MQVLFAKWEISVTFAIASSGLQKKDTSNGQQNKA